MTTLGPAERAVLLAFADDEHLMGQRHTEWIGVAPFLEEDLAFASIGQDELGHAAMLYELVISDLSGETPSAQSVDALAFRREPDDYRSCWLVEAPCTEWADRARAPLAVRHGRGAAVAGARPVRPTRACATSPPGR